MSAIFSDNGGAEVPCYVNSLYPWAWNGSQVCYGWAPDGPQAMGPFLGLPKAGRKLDMCQIFVQNLSKQGIMIHLHFGWKMAHGQNVDSIWISVGPEIIHVLSTCRVTRW